jgi:hypothetical protein
LCESDNGWSCPGTLGVLDNPWGLALHHSDSRVGGTKIDTDDLALDLLSLSRRRLIASEL